jgi:hypothetical protein
MMIKRLFSLTPDFWHSEFHHRFLNRPRQRGSAQAMIVNLNKYQKQRERAEGERRAAENRVRFGRGKPARAKDQREHQQAEKSLEDKRLD